MDEPQGYPAYEPAVSVVEDIFNVGELNLIGGSRGSGKTALECWMLAKVLRGDPFLGHRTFAPSWYGALIFDRDQKDRQQWWKAAGVYPDRYYSITNDAKVSPDSLIKMCSEPSTVMFNFLTRKLHELKPPKNALVTIDVINPFCGPPQMSYGTSYAHGWGIARLAKDMDICIVGLIHGGKQKAMDRYVRATDRIIAPTGLLGAVHTVSYITTPQESDNNGLQEYSWEPHHHAPEEFTLRRITSSGLFEQVDPVELASQAKLTTPKAPPGPMLTEKLHDYLKYFPAAASGVFITTAEVLERACAEKNYHPVTVKKHLADLKALGFIVNFQGLQGKFQQAGEDKAN